MESKKVNVIRVKKLVLNKKQASKMLDASNAKYSIVKIGYTVRACLPDVERTRSDGRILYNLSKSNNVK